MSVPLRARAVMRPRLNTAVPVTFRSAPKSGLSNGRVCWTLYERDGQGPPAVCRLVPQPQGYLVVVEGLGSSLHWHCAEEAAANERASFLAAQMTGLGWTPHRSS